MQTLYDRYIVSLTTYLGTKKLLIWEQLVGLSKRYVDEEMQRRGSNSISRGTRRAQMVLEMVALDLW